MRRVPPPPTLENLPVIGLMVMTFESMCSKEEEVLSDVDGTITRTGVVASGVIGSGVGGSITDKCVRADATLD